MSEYALYCEVGSGFLWGKRFPPDTPARNALLYTVDMLSVVNLGYGKWVAHGTVLTVTTVLIVFGWMPATVVATAFAGVLRSSD